MCTLYTIRCQHIAKLFEKLVVEAPHLNGAFLGFAKLLVREQKYLRATKILQEGLTHHPKDELLKEYFVSLKEKTAQPRPSVLYTPSKSAQNNSSTDSNQQQLPHHQTSLSLSTSNGNNNHGNRGGVNKSPHSHPKSSVSHDVYRISPQQKLNSNLESSTDQFVKGVSFGSNNGGTSLQNTQAPSYSTNISNSNMSGSAISLSMSGMSEDMHTPPLPNLQSARGRISNLLNKHQDLSSSSAPLKEMETLESPSPPAPNDSNENENEEGDDALDDMKAANGDRITPRKYSERKSETNLNIISSQNPLNKHRKSIKQKIGITEQQIYQKSSANSVVSKSKKYSSAPRTSQQFNPKTIKKRQSLQLNQSALNGALQSSTTDSAEKKKMRRKTTSAKNDEAAKNNGSDCLIM